MSESSESIPAIDILGGQVVRLRHGDYDAVTVYAEDPVAMARQLADGGAERLHIVDLDGAKAGRPINGEAIARIAAESPLRLQVGGGVRDAAAARAWWAAGVERVVMGTAAVKAPQMVADLCQEKVDGVVVAIDARRGEVAVEGWLEGSGQEATVLAKTVDGWGAAAILFTCIERDGTGEGPDVAATAALQSVVSTTVIASGGIGSLEDLRALKAAGVRASVCGKALYAGAFTVQEAVAATC